MAFGDEANDYSMLSLARVSVAMDNAIPSIKKVSTNITKSNAEDGVAEFLESYFSL
jgi:hydroxymethylpyrimidine pyrophosphatase-like HAD family hydrolase